MRDMQAVVAACFSMPLNSLKASKSVTGANWTTVLKARIGCDDVQGDEAAA